MLSYACAPPPNWSCICARYWSSIAWFWFLFAVASVPISSIVAFAWFTAPELSVPRILPAMSNTPMVYSFSFSAFLSASSISMLSR